MTDVTIQDLQEDAAKDTREGVTYVNKLRAAAYERGTTLHDVENKKIKVPNTSKNVLHRKMRSLGMGKHANGSAHTLANHSRVPDAVTVGEGKTLGQWKSERKEKAKRKNKMARKSRARNRR
jgi:hypothetical protein